MFEEPNLGDNIFDFFMHLKTISRYYQFNKKLNGWNTIKEHNSKEKFEGMFENGIPQGLFVILSKYIRVKAKLTLDISQIKSKIEDDNVVIDYLFPVITIDHGHKQKSDYWEITGKINGLAYGMWSIKLEECGIEYFGECDKGMPVGEWKVRCLNGFIYNAPNIRELLFDPFDEFNRKSFFPLTIPKSLFGYRNEGLPYFARLYQVKVPKFDECGFLSEDIVENTREEHFKRGLLHGKYFLKENVSESEMSLTNKQLFINLCKTDYNEDFSGINFVDYRFYNEYLDESIRGFYNMGRKVGVWSFVTEFYEKLVLFDGDAVIELIKYENSGQKLILRRQITFLEIKQFVRKAKPTLKYKKLAKIQKLCKNALQLYKLSQKERIMTQNKFKSENIK